MKIKCNKQRKFRREVITVIRPLDRLRKAFKRYWARVKCVCEWFWVWLLQTIWKSLLGRAYLQWNLSPTLCYLWYRSGTVNSNTVNSKFHLIRSYCEIFFYNFPNIPCLKYSVNSNFHLIRSKTLPTNDFELTVPDL